MNQRIGINLDKILDSYSRRIKIPAITQKQDKICDYNEEYEDLIDDDTMFLEDYDDNCIMDYIDIKNIAILGLGIIAGAMGIYILSKGRR